MKKAIQFFSIYQFIFTDLTGGNSSSIMTESNSLQTPHLQERHVFPDILDTIT